LHTVLPTESSSGAALFNKPFNPIARENARSGLTAALERMKEKTRTRPTGATILAIVLGWLGIAGLLNAIAWPLMLNSDLMKSAPPEFVARFPTALGSVWLSLCALAYGISALFTAVALWQLSPVAPKSYLAWVGAVVALMLALLFGVPRVPLLAAAAFLVPFLIMLAAGWLYTRRLVQ
jgi:hypothetical protein